MFVLIMIDECGDEVEYDRWNLHLDFDEDELEVWKERKERRAREEYPEAQGFYWEDRRHWESIILNDFFGESFSSEDDED